MCPVVLEATYWECTSQHLLVVFTVFPKNRWSIYRCQRGATMGDTSTNINQLVGHLWTSMVELKLAVWLIAICTFRHQGLQSFLCDFDDSFLIRRFAEFETSTIRPSSDHQIIHQFHQYLQIPRPWAMRNPLRSLQFQNVEGQAMNCTSNRHRHDAMGRRFFMETTQELRIQQSKMASGWWFQPTPLKNMSLFVVIMKFPQYMESHSKAMFQSPPTNG